MGRILGTSDIGETGELKRSISTRLTFMDTVFAWRNGKSQQVRESYVSNQSLELIMLIVQFL